MKQLKNSHVFFILGFVALLSHWMILPVGLSLTDAEFSVFLMIADEFSRGQFSIFPMGQNYAGQTAALLRGLLLWLHRFFDPSAMGYLSAQMIVSYVLTPWLVAIAYFLYLKTLVSKNAALFASLLAAVGFQFWLVYFGNDFYFFYLALGAILLSIRSPLKNSFFELSRKRLFFVSVLCGHLYFVSTAALIYVFAFLMPTEIHFSRFFQKIKPSKPFEKKWLSLVYVLGAAFLYLYLFGREIGSLPNGKVLKIDALPNLKLGVFFLMAYILFKFRFDIKRDWVLRSALVAAGFLLGDFFGVWFGIENHFRYHYTPRMNELVSYDFETTLFVVKKSFDSFRELVARGDGFSRNGPLVFFLLSCVIGIRESFRVSRYRPAAVVFFLTIFFYVTFNTWVSPISPARFLFPMYVSLFAFVAISFDYFQRSKWLSLFVLLALLSGGHQLWERYQIAKDPARQRYVQSLFEIVESYKSAGVRVVLSDEFEQSNQYSLVSGRNPAFWSTQRQWGPAEARDGAHVEKRIGVMLKARAGLNAEKIHEIDLLDRHFRLELLSKIHDRWLYVGTSDKPSSRLPEAMFRARRY